MGKSLLKDTEGGGVILNNDGFVHHDNDWNCVELPQDYFIVKSGQLLSEYKYVEWSNSQTNSLTVEKNADNVTFKLSGLSGHSTAMYLFLKQLPANVTKIYYDIKATWNTGITSLEIYVHNTNNCPGGGESMDRVTLPVTSGTRSQGVADIPSKYEYPSYAYLGFGYGAWNSGSYRELVIYDFYVK